MDMMFVISNC